jgi:hypothetical protein
MEVLCIRHQAEPKSVNPGRLAEGLLVIPCCGVVCTKLTANALSQPASGASLSTHVTYMPPRMVEHPGSQGIKVAVNGPCTLQCDHTEHEDVAFL